MVKELLYVQLTKMRSDHVLHHFTLGPQFPHLYNGAQNPLVCYGITRAVSNEVLWMEKCLGKL